MSSATGRLSALWFRELQGGPACYRPFRVGRRPPALSTALGDVYSSTHSASGATSNAASLPTSLVPLAAIILANNTQYSEVSAGQCATAPAGGGCSVESQTWLLLTCSLLALEDMGMPLLSISLRKCRSAVASGQ